MTRGRAAVQCETHTPARRWLCVAGIASALIGAVSAQAALDVRLRADPALSGPPALVWARQQLPRFAATALDVRGGLRVQISAAGVAAQADPTPLPAGIYLAGRIEARGGAAVDVECDDGGLETWRAAPATLAACEPTRDLLATTDVLRATGSTAAVDVAVLVGLLGVGLDTESPTGLLLTLGAAECGELHVRATAKGTDLRVEGRSRGGLTWPALLLALARATGTRDLGEERRWIVLAFAARDGRQEEAAMQLARFDSVAGTRCLRALLHADSDTRVRAIEALARRGASEALPAMLAAASGDAACTVTAGAALAALWPRCSDEVRRTARARAATDPTLRAAVASSDQVIALAGIGQGGPSPTLAAPGMGRTILAALLAVTALVLLGRVVIGARHQRIS